MELKQIKGIGPAKQEKLAQANVKSVSDLAHADLHALANSTGISYETLKDYQEKAVAYELIQGIRRVGPATLKTLAENGIKSMKDLVDAGKHYAEAEAASLKSKAGQAQVSAKDFVEKVRSDAKTPEGRKKLVAESKDFIQKTAKQTEARAKDLASKIQKDAKDLSSKLQKETKELTSKAKSIQHDAPEQARELLKQAEGKIRETEEKARKIVKTEMEKVRAQNEQLVGRVKKTLHKQD